MIISPRLTEAQRDIVAGIAISVVTTILASLATIWLTVSVIVGTVVLGRWIAGGF